MSRWFSNPTALLVVALGSIGLAPACGSTVSGGGSGGGAGSGSAGAGSAAGTGGGTVADETGGTGAGPSGVTYFKASNTDAGDLFGVSAALSADGSTLVVGASREGSSTISDEADDAAADAGAAYVFVQSGGMWQQQAYLKASSPGGGDAFGTTVALSTDGTTLAIGAPFESSAADGVDGDEDADTDSNAGAVYVFTSNDGTWQQQAYLKASSSDADDFFGVSIALSADGNVLAVGAEGEDGASVGINADESDKTAFESGAVYLFRRSGASWQQTDYLKASNAGVGDHFGGAVSLSADGNALSVGAYWEDSAAAGVDGDQGDDSAGSAGAVYIFGYDGGAWAQRAYLKGSSTDGGASDNFGTAVSLSGDGETLAVGAVGQASYAGMVYVFERAGASWQEVASLTASGANEGDEFGYHIHLSADGQALAVGAALEASLVTGAEEAGAAYVFRRNGSAWTESGRLEAPNVDGGDRFGWSVSLSAQGTLVVGATREASSATGLLGDPANNGASRAGAAYVYQLNSMAGWP